MRPSSTAALDAQEVHVWMAPPHRLLAAAAGHDAWLSTAERARSTRYRDPEDGARYRATRVLIRGILAGVVGRGPGALEFVENVHGRPSLREPVPGGLDFNASRSEGWVVLAVHAGAVCGIDVEDLSRPSDLAAVARRFAPAERALLDGLPEFERRRTFFELWTLKEAFLKALGTGLTVSLGAAAFTLDPGQPPRASFGPPLAEDPAGWSFAQLAPDAGHVAAVAVRSARPPALVLHDQRETCDRVASAR